MRILSSAEKCRRVARRIFFTTSVAGSFSGTDFCLIFAPCEGYDEPEILPSSTHPICLMSADGGHVVPLLKSGLGFRVTSLHTGLPQKGLSTFSLKCRNSSRWTALWAASRLPCFLMRSFQFFTWALCA